MHICKLIMQNNMIAYLLIVLFLMAFALAIRKRRRLRCLFVIDTIICAAIIIWLIVCAYVLYYDDV